MKNLRQNQSFISIALLVFLAIIWGLSFILVKKIVVNFSSVEMGAGRIFIAGFSLIPWAIKHYKDLPKKKLPVIILSGTLGYLIPAFIFGLLGSKLNSSLSGALNATTPMFVLIAGVFLFKKQFIPAQAVGIFFGLIGCLILVLSGGKNELNFNNPYAILAVVATVMYGINANLVGTKLADVKPIIISAFSLVSVGIIAFFVLLGTDFFAKIFLPENRLLLVYFIFLGSVNSAFAAVLYNYLVQKISPVFASSVTYLVPIVATIAGIFDGEIIGIYHYFGMFLILIAVYLLNTKYSFFSKIKLKV